MICHLPQKENLQHELLLKFVHFRLKNILVTVDQKFATILVTLDWNMSKIKAWFSHNHKNKE